MELALGIVVLAVIYWIIKTIIENIAYILLGIGGLFILYLLAKTLETKEGQKFAGGLFLVGLAAMGGALAIAAVGAVALGSAQYVDQDALSLAYLAGEARKGTAFTWAVWGYYGAFTGLSLGAAAGLWRTHRHWRSALVGLVLGAVPFAIVPALSAIRDPFKGACEAACTHSIPFLRQAKRDASLAAISRKKGELSDREATHTRDADALTNDLMAAMQRHDRTPEEVTASFEAKGKALDADYAKDVTTKKSELEALAKMDAKVAEELSAAVSSGEVDQCAAACVRSGATEGKIDCVLDATSYGALSPCGLSLGENIPSSAAPVDSASAAPSPPPSPPPAPRPPPAAPAVRAAAAEPQTVSANVVMRNASGRPGRANVYVDGKIWPERTPTVIRARAGMRHIKGVLEDGGTDEQDVEFSSGHKLRIILDARGQGKVVAE
jgi:hypothetical protein